MAEQLSLMGFEAEAAPPREDRLFLALQPDARAAEAIGHHARHLQQQYALHGREIPPERLHITLHHLGDHAGVPRNLVQQVEQLAASFSAGGLGVGFGVTFDRVLSFARPGRQQPLVLTGGAGLDSVRDFQRQLGQAMTQAGLGKQVDRTFTPHVTLLYDKLTVPEHAVPTVAWQVQEWVLIHSLLNRSTHRVLGRWPLRPA